MTNQNSTEIKSSLNDTQIVEVARKIDEFILDIGKEYQPTGIEFAAIAVGRLMVFTSQVGCHDTFMDMLSEITKLREPAPLSKTGDLSQESA